MHKRRLGRLVKADISQAEARGVHERDALYDPCGGGACCQRPNLPNPQKSVLIFGVRCGGPIDFTSGKRVVSHSLAMSTLEQLGTVQ